MAKNGNIEMLEHLRKTVYGKEEDAKTFDSLLSQACFRLDLTKSKIGKLIEMTPLQVAHLYKQNECAKWLKMQYRWYI